MYCIAVIVPIRTHSQAAQLPLNGACYNFAEGNASPTGGATREILQKRAVDVVEIQTETMADAESFDPVAYINAPRWQMVDLGLDRMVELMDLLGRPQDHLKFVHVAGTNGKGSVCAYLDGALRACGYRTGLFTSPYIITFEERIRVDGQNIPLDDLTAITLRVRDAAESMTDHPTEFELMWAVALLYFHQCACDIVVAEVGLGGRYDATNIIAAPEAAVIVRLGLDHTDILGDTIEKIAGEKAGIIKPGTQVVTWPQEPGALEVVRQAAAACNAPLRVVDFNQLDVAPLAIDTASNRLPARSFAYQGVPYTTRLLASYQPSNAALALEALDILRSRGWNLPVDAVQNGIANTVWPARFEICATRPLTIVDGGHNPQGAQVLAESLQETLPGIKPVIVAGILADKDYRAMLSCVVPLASAVVCVTPPVPRRLPAEDLAVAVREVAQEAGILDLPVAVADGFSDALSRAQALAGEAGVVCCFGSLYSVGQLKGALACMN